MTQLSRESDPLIKAAGDVETAQKLVPVLHKAREDVIQLLENTQLDGKPENELFALEMVRRLHTMAHMRAQLIGAKHLGEVAITAANSEE